MPNYPKPVPPDNWNGTDNEFWDTDFPCVFCDRIYTLRHRTKHMESKICADWLQINLNKFHKKNKNFDEDKYIKSLELKDQKKLQSLESVRKYGTDFYCNPYHCIEKYNEEHGIIWTDKQTSDFIKNL